MLAAGFAQMPLLDLENALLFQLWEFLSWMVSNCVKSFIYTYWGHHIFFSFILLKWWVTLILNVKQAHLPEINSTWPQWKVSCLVELGLSGHRFIKPFCICVHKRCWPLTPCSCYTRLMFCIGVICPHRMSWESFPFFTLWHYLFLAYLIGFSSKAIWGWIFLCG